MTALIPGFNEPLEDVDTQVDDAERLEKVCQACRCNDLAKLRQWKVDGTLSNLMHTDYDQDWYPHEYAAWYGQLDVLKWLVLDSGQVVDLTAHHNGALRQAAKASHFEVVKWLVLESGQKVDVAEYNNALCYIAEELDQAAFSRWLLVDSGQLHRILQKGTLDWMLTLPADLRRLVRHAKLALTALTSNELKKQLEDAELLDRFLLSPACQSAASAGLLRTLEDVNKLLESPMPTRERLKKL